MNWWRELKRRNVVRVGIAYGVTSWILVQLALLLFDTFAAPAWVGRVFISLLLLCFPLVLIFAWAFELTPEGIKRTHEVDRQASITRQTGRKINYMITAALAVAVVFLVWDRFAHVSVSDDGNTATTAVTTAVTATDESSIAVLPFSDMSPDGDQGYFADGISEELLNLLGRLEGLKVAARTSSFAFKGRDENVKTIAETLDVANVLEGSVRKAGTTLRITAQLIDADTGFHLWSDTFDRELDDVFAIQDEIASSIVAALEHHLGLDAIAPTATRSSNIDAYGAFLEGRYLVQKRTQPTLEQAAAAFEKAIALDPEYAPAYAALAETTLLLSAKPSSYGEMDPAEALARARPLVDRALALAPDSAEAHVARGFVLYEQEEYQASVTAYQRALAINPNLVRAHIWLSSSLELLGFQDEAFASIGRAVALDPLSHVAVSNLTGGMIARDRVDEALAAVEKLVRVHDDTRAYTTMGRLHFVQGHLDESHSWYREALARTPGDRNAERGLLLIYASLGLYDRSAALANPGWESYWVQSLAGEPAAAAAGMQARADEIPVDIVQQIAAQLHLWAGDPAAARAALEPLADRTSGHEGPLFMLWSWPAAKLLVEARLEAGDQRGAEQLLDDLHAFLADLRASGFRGARLLILEAEAFALSGDTDKALQRLRALVDRRWIGIMDLADMSTLANLKDNPDFDAIVADYRREHARQRTAVLQQLGEPARL